MALLEVKDVEVRFGGIVALSGMTFDIEEGQICGLIGPNGAGKTTMFNVISRIYDPTAGTLRFNDVDLLKTPPHLIAETGIFRTFQNLALWPRMSVIENVMAGAHVRSKQNFGSAMLNVGRKKEEKKLASEAFTILTDLGLANVAFQQCAGLPYGTLKRIELARCLIGHPKLLMLDEPATGLTHSEVDELSIVIQKIRTDYNLTILLVEHHMGLVMSISENVVVLDFGRKIAEGLPAAVQERPRGDRGLPGGTRMSDTSTTTDLVLDVKGLEGGYGQIQVLHGLDFHVADGEIVVILGANGAGKTTTLRAVSGMIPRTGSVKLRGEDISNAKAPDLVRQGVAHVPQGRGTLPELSVEDNLRVGAYIRDDNEVDADIDKWFGVYPVLGERKNQRAGSLSGGEQQMLAVSRALMSRPSLLLLDEPSLGLAPIIVAELFERFAEINKETGTTMLVVEQNAQLALGIGDRGYVLESGEIFTEGPADELINDDAIRKAYLGV